MPKEKRIVTEDYFRVLKEKKLAEKALSQVGTGQTASQNKLDNLGHIDSNREGGDSAGPTP